MCVVEVMTTTFTFLSFALALFVIALTQYVTGNFHTNRDIAIFAILSIFFTVFFRKIFKSTNDTEEINSDSDVNKY